MSFERPYEGLKVVDLSQGLAGPYCGMLMAQQGADVIKIEPQDGDWARLIGGVYGDHTAYSVVGEVRPRPVVPRRQTRHGDEPEKRTECRNRRQADRAG